MYLCRNHQRFPVREGSETPETPETPEPPEAPVAQQVAGA